MALKLSAPVAATTAAAPPATSLSALRARAAACVVAQDTAGWRACWSGAAGLPDPHQRLAVRRALAETALGARELSAPATATLFATLARELLDAQEGATPEPTLLNHLGVALYELGAVRPAEALFTAVARLDRDLPHVHGNLEECRRRRKAGTAEPRGLPASVIGALRDLEPRARRLAAAAKPVAGLTLSLCMIVKDEEAMLGRCLAAAADAVDEIVVVDTGSTDKTVEIAESFGARVVHHTWTGDFAAARNVSFDAATSDWLLYLDADEVLVAEDAVRLRALTGRTWREAFYLVETNHVGDLDDGTAVTHQALRLFRNRPQYRFTGRIHEQIAHTLPGLPERLEHSDVRVEHFGYLGAVRDAKGKSKRNVELLERQVAEGQDTPFLHFNLGSEHAAAGDAPKSLESFRRAWAQLADDPGRTGYGYTPSLASRLVKALRVCGCHGEVDPVAEEALALFPGFTDVVFEQGHAARGRGDLDAAAAHFRRCLALGDAPATYSATVGCGSHMARTALGSVLAEQGDLDAAAEQLAEALRESPGFLGTVEPYAHVLLRRGTAPEDVVAAVHAGVGKPTPAVRFVLAVSLYEAGAVAEAEVELRELLDDQPSAEPARVALAEALLSQGRLAEAAQEADRVPEGHAVAAAAARSAAFARAASGEPAGDDPRLDEADRLLFCAWSSPSPDPLPAAVAPRVVVALEALARLEAFDAFEELVAVLERIDVPWRDRRELLAGVYLRRGFLQSAADEWITVVQQSGPDAAAYAGLSVVAARQGLDEEAEAFAAEARAIAAG